jgi:hypothetical protein
MNRSGQPSTSLPPVVSWRESVGASEWLREWWCSSVALVAVCWLLPGSHKASGRLPGLPIRFPFFLRLVLGNEPAEQHDLSELVRVLDFDI